MNTRRLVIIFFSCLILLSGLYIVYKIVDDSQEVASEPAQEKLYKVVLAHYAQKEYENTIHLGESFLEKYPQSPYFSDVLLNIGQSYFNLREYDKAIQSYELLLDKFPNYKLEKYVLDKIERAAEYKKDLVLSLELGSGGVQTDFEKCKKLFDDKQYQKSARALKLYLQNYPDSPFASNAEYLIADSYFNLGDFELAAKLYQQVIEKYPQSEELYLSKRRLEKIGSLKEKKSGSSLTEIYKKALDKYYAKNFDAAIEEFSDFLTLYPKSDLAPNCQYWLAESFYSLDKKSQALSEFEKVVKFYPSSSKAKDAKIKIKMITDARAESKSSQEFQDYKNIRKTYLVGKYRKAIKDFDNFLVQFPDSKYVPNAYYWKAECYYSLEEYEDAISVFEQILQLFPDSQKANHATVKIRMSKEKLGIVEYTPQEALYKKSYGLYESKKFEQAIASFDDYMQKFPSTPLVENCLYWIGECYYAMEDFAKAADYFRQTMERYPSGNKRRTQKSSMICVCGKVGSRCGKGVDL